MPTSAPDTPPSPTPPAAKPAAKTDETWLTDVQAPQFFDFTAALSVPLPTADAPHNPPLDDAAYASDDDTRTFFDSLASDPARHRTLHAQSRPPLTADLRNPGPPLQRHRPSTSFETLLQRHPSPAPGSAPAGPLSPARSALPVPAPQRPRTPRAPRPPARVSRRPPERIAGARTGSSAGARAGSSAGARTRTGSSADAGARASAITPSSAGSNTPTSAGQAASPASRQSPLQSPALSVSPVGRAVSSSQEQPQQPAPAPDAAARRLPRRAVGAQPQRLRPLSARSPTTAGAAPSTSTAPAAAASSHMASALPSPRQRPQSVRSPPRLALPSPRTRPRSLALPSPRTRVGGTAATAAGASSPRTFGQSPRTSMLASPPPRLRNSLLSPRQRTTSGAGSSVSATAVQAETPLSPVQKPKPRPTSIAASPLAARRAPAAAPRPKSERIPSAAASIARAAAKEPSLSELLSKENDRVLKERRRKWTARQKALETDRQRLRAFEGVNNDQREQAAVAFTAAGEEASELAEEQNQDENLQENVDPMSAREPAVSRPAPKATDRKASQPAEQRTRRTLLGQVGKENSSGTERRGLQGLRSRNKAVSQAEAADKTEKERGTAGPATRAARKPAQMVLSDRIKAAARQKRIERQLEADLESLLSQHNKRVQGIRRQRVGANG